MILQNCTLMLSNALKQRLFFVTASLDSLAKSKMISSKVSQTVFDSVQFFNSVFETSVKSYIDISKIHLLDKFFNPVNEIRNTYSFVINEAIAKDIVKEILLRIDCNKSIILEANPGLGLITLNLINSGASCVYVCDSSQLQDLSLSQILQKHPDKLTLKKINIIKNSDSIFLSAFDEAQKQNLSVTLLGITTSFYILRLLVIVFLKNGLWRNPFEIYLVLSSVVWNNVRNFNPVYYKFFYYCAFNILFNSEKIGSYPCSAFLPVSKTNYDFNFIRISINPNLFKHLEENELMDYIIFVTILGTSSYNFIIPTLEKWLPNCGPYLISKGISVSNTVRDLSHQESVTLFKLFKNCEGYSDFKVCIGHAFEGAITGS